MNRLLTIVAALLIVAGGGYWWMNRSQTSSTAFELPGAASAQETSGGAAPDLSLVKEEAIGDPNAPVTVIEYASFTCPHCRDWHTYVWPQFKADYVDSGKVQFILREVYFDRYGLWAGMLARCGGSSERYFAMVDEIFDNQSEWLAPREPAGISAALKQLAKETGLTETQFDTCLQDKAMAEALVATYQKNATEDGIRATPTFVINGELQNNVPWEEFRQVLDAAVDKAS